MAGKDNTITTVAVNHLSGQYGEKRFDSSTQKITRYSQSDFFANYMNNSGQISDERVVHHAPIIAINPSNKISTSNANGPLP